MSFRFLLRPSLLTALALTGMAGCGGITSPADPLYDEIGSNEQVLAAAARQRALDTLPSRSSLEWRAEEGAWGRITPLRTFRADTGLYCREFEEEVNAAGRSDRFTDIRCRTDSGRWLRPEA